MSSRYTDEQYATAMRRIHAAGDWAECDCDINSDPVVSNGEGEGAFVQAWLWVSDETMASMGFDQQQHATEEK